MCDKIFTIINSTISLIRSFTFMKIDRSKNFHNNADFPDTTYWARLTLRLFQPNRKD